MGYTHYWHIDYDKATYEQLGKWALDTQKLVAAARERGIKIGGQDHWDGRTWSGPDEGTEEFTEKYVLFNGVEDEAHEGFYVALRPGDPDDLVAWFCKTERKPYDVVVAAAVLRLKHHLGDAVDIGSDGRERDEAQWQPALDLYADVFGERIAYEAIPWEEEVTL
jgi:hypothetical protein